LQMGNVSEDYTFVWKAAQMRLQTRLNYPSFAGYAVTLSDVRSWG